MNEKIKNEKETEKEKEIRVRKGLNKLISHGHKQINDYHQRWDRLFD